LPISYTITIENQGILTATNVIVTDTLPAAVAYITSSHSAIESGSDIIWHLGDISPGNVFDIILEGVVDGNAANSTIENNVVATQSGFEQDLGDNSFVVSSTVAEPQSILSIPTQFPNLIVPQGSANELVIDVSNTGTDLLTAVVISPSTTLPDWITVSPVNLGDIPYQSGSNILPFTITANATGAPTPGYYRDIVTIQTGNAGTLPIYLTVQVQMPLRDVQLNIANDGSYPVEGALVTLVEPLYAVTQGQPGYENYYWQGSSDANGHLVFPSLESGKEYDYTITAPNHESASGVIAIGSESGVQIEDIALIGLPGLVVQPEALTFSATRGQTKQ
ncbi:MAG: DUF11 domain-containing protein, partial [Chloroflexi bacterium]|nr:DUF11 domain-containing protein [Chloroflexota bacterium]